jgi:hypothetical protein
MIVSYAFRAIRSVRLLFSLSFDARAIPQKVRAISESISRKSAIALFARSSLREAEIENMRLNADYGIPL